MTETVLVVADTKDDRTKLESIVEHAGYLVTGVCSGREALRRTLEPVPDCVLLDVSTDHMDGFRVCRELSGDPALRNTRMIMISDRDQNVDRLWAEQQGASALVTKPYSDEQLVEQLRRPA